MLPEVILRPEADPPRCYFENSFLNLVQGLREANLLISSLLTGSLSQTKCIMSTKRSEIAHFFNSRKGGGEGGGGGGRVYDLVGGVLGGLYKEKAAYAFKNT